MLEGTRTYNDLYYVGPQEKEQYLADIYRIWIQQEGVVAAHVNAAQHHTRSNYMRNPPAAEIFNEEVSNLIKRKVKDSVSRIHELCGFPRRAGEFPVPYPLACAPQAWAAASVLLLLKACLGVRIDARHRRVTFSNPDLRYGSTRCQYVDWRSTAPRWTSQSSAIAAHLVSACSEGIARSR